MTGEGKSSRLCDSEIRWERVIFRETAIPATILWVGNAIWGLQIWFSVVDYPWVTARSKTVVKKKLQLPKSFCNRGRKQVSAPVFANFVNNHLKKKKEEKKTSLRMICFYTCGRQRVGHDWATKHTQGKEWKEKLPMLKVPHSICL